MKRLEMLRLKAGRRLFQVHMNPTTAGFYGSALMTRQPFDENKKVIWSD